jgi:hypothetical protein
MNDAREKALAVAMWRVGGGRLAEIGHRALGLPGLSTLRHNTVIRPLLPSAGRPRVEEIEYNIDACLDALPEEPEARPQILHQCLIMDEVATEKRVRHDDRTNKVVGVCRPHGYLLPLDLQTEKDLETLCDGLREEKAHIAGEVCFFFHGGASLSLTRYVIARPLLPLWERSPQTRGSMLSGRFCSRLTARKKPVQNMQ